VVEGLPCIWKQQCERLTTVRSRMRRSWTQAVPLIVPGGRVRISARPDLQAAIPRSRLHRIRQRNCLRERLYRRPRLASGIRVRHEKVEPNGSSPKALLLGLLSSPHSLFGPAIHFLHFAAT
jgi:hypothetical protein